MTQITYRLLNVLFVFIIFISVMFSVWLVTEMTPAAAPAAVETVAPLELQQLRLERNIFQQQLAPSSTQQ